MKKKALALLLAAAMAIQPLSVAGAGEFTDGQSVDVEAEAVEEVAEEPVEVFTDNAAEEPVVEEEKAPRSEVLREPIKDAIQIGDKVWVTFDNVTQTATIWGEGRTWDYDALGWEEIKGQHFNPFRNRAFQNIVIKNNITYLGNNLFSSCSGFGDELIIPDDVTAIGESTFQCIMGLKKVVLPKNISAIGKMAFAQCEDLTEVVNPGTLKEISEHAFMWCSDLGKFDFSGVEKIGVGAFDGTNFKKLYLTNDLRIIEDDAFSGANIQELNIPESVVKIGAGAFSGNNMENLIIPNTVSELESSVFAECNNLTNVVLPNMEIELVSTFENCDRLLFVSIPERITSLIGTFSGCDRLSTVEIKGSKTQIPTYGIDNDESAFDMCPRLTLIKGQYCSYAKKYANDHKISFTNFEPQNEHDWSAEKL